MVIFTVHLVTRSSFIKKSGNASKGSKRPHFAHAPNTSTCSAESTLHLVANHLLAGYLEKKLHQQSPLPFTWQCDYCGEQHQGELGRTAVAVAMEYHLGDVRPDILLFNSGGLPVVALEIVVTHTPESEALAHYEYRKIQVIEIHLSNDQDIDQLEKLIAEPTIVQACRNPCCAKCQTRMQINELMIIHGKCWRCDKSMKVACKEGRSYYCGPEEFTDSERTIAKNHGAIIKKRNLEWESGVWVNCCPGCGVFVGAGHLCSQYVTKANMGELSFQRIKAGYICSACQEEEMKKREEEGDENDVKYV